MMSDGSWASWRAAQEIPDREEEPEMEEITDWSVCETHGKYPTEDTEIIGEGFTICPICYKEEIKNVRCGTCKSWSRKGNHGTGWCSRWDCQKDARLKMNSCWNPKQKELMK